ncbi:hypothetical protein [Paenibacillus alginolyticus]|uniref:Uncharacterized protein n=1 Tax=Paenibacillus alginolyticus TaxID=59839 RepID=A0ABT4GNQ2_9BACL|nr:hypothetical protein [Paenibacillus alginolyticus]MCY9697843.1 hypothetical protein [Paenibacillus alginolyticus]MEC0141891.1 hypothetical protein [Paenibacillus alginolyticus]
MQRKWRETVGEPFCNWIMVVVYIKWKYMYSFVYYNVIEISVRVIVEKLNAKQEELSPNSAQKII